MIALFNSFFETVAVICVAWIVWMIWTSIADLFHFKIATGNKYRQKEIKLLHSLVNKLSDRIK